MTALALCRFTHFLAAMLVFGMSAYLWAYAPERLRLALSPAVRRARADRQRCYGHQCNCVAGARVRLDGRRMERR